MKVLKTTKIVEESDQTTLVGNENAEGVGLIKESWDTVDWI